MGLFLSAAVYFLLNESSFMTLIIIVCLWCGLFGPNMVLAKMVSERKDRVKAAVPDASISWLCVPSLVLASMRLSSESVMS